MLQTDRNVLGCSQKPVMIRIGKISISQDHLDGNRKLSEYLEYYGETHRCERCRMIMDPDEIGICKYCAGDF